MPRKLANAYLIWSSFAVNIDISHMIVDYTTAILLIKDAPSSTTITSTQFSILFLTKTALKPMSSCKSRNTYIQSSNEGLHFAFQVHAEILGWF